MSLPIPTLLLKPEGSRDRNGVVSPVLTGAVRTVPGSTPGSQAWFVEEGTTNHFSDPDSTGAVGGLGPSAATLTPLTDEQGKGFIRFVRTGAGFWGAYAGGLSRPSMMAGETWTISGQVRAPQGDVGSITVIFGGVTTVVPITAEWTPFSVTATTAIDRPNHVTTLYSQQSGSTLGLVLDYRKMQIERKPYATSHCSGSMGTGYSWAGAAHASASTRVGGDIAVTHQLSPIQGSILYRARMRQKAAISGYIVSAGLFNIPWFMIRSGSSGYLRSPAGVNQVFPGLRNLNLSEHTGRLVTEALWWSATQQGVNSEDGARSSVARTNWVDGTFQDPTIRIGIASQSKNMEVDAVVAFDRPLTDAEYFEVLAMPSWRWDRFGGRTLSYGAVA